MSSFGSKFPLLPSLSLALLTYLLGGFSTFYFYNFMHFCISSVHTQDWQGEHLTVPQIHLTKSPELLCAKDCPRGWGYKMTKTWPYMTLFYRLIIYMPLEHTGQVPVTDPQDILLDRMKGESKLAGWMITVAEERLSKNSDASHASAASLIGSKKTYAFSSIRCQRLWQHV